MIVIWYRIIGTRGEVLLYSDSLVDVFGYVQGNYYMTFDVVRKDEDDEVLYEIHVH